MSKYFYSKNVQRVWGKPIWSPIGRLLWPSLTSPKEEEFNGNKTLRYMITVAVDKTDPKMDVFLDELNTMVYEEGEGMLATYNSNSKGAKLALPDELVKDGDSFNMEKYPYYKGKMVLLARSPGDKAIPVIGPKGKADKLDPSVIVGGMLGRILIVPHIGPTGLSFKAEAVQLWKDDGVRYGGGTRNIDEFMSAISDDSTECEAVSEDSEIIPEEFMEVTEPEVVVAKSVGRPKKVVAAPIQVTPTPTRKSPEVMAAELRARQAVAGVKVPAGSKAVTTGKGKGLALDNL